MSNKTLAFSVSDLDCKTKFLVSTPLSLDFDEGIHSVKETLKTILSVYTGSKLCILTPNSDIVENMFERFETIYNSSLANKSITFVERSGDDIMSVELYVE